MLNKIFGKKEDNNSDSDNRKRSSMEERIIQDRNNRDRSGSQRSSSGFGSRSDGESESRITRSNPSTREPIGSRSVIRRAESSDISDIGERGQSVIRRNVEKQAEATDEEIKALLDYTGEVYTAQSGSLPTTDAQRVYACFLADGTLLISKDAPANAMVLEVKQAIRRHNRIVKKEILVDMSVIRQIHEEADRRNGLYFKKTSRGMGENIQHMQHELLKLIREAASKRASDIHVFIQKNMAIIKIRAGGIMMNLREEHPDWSADLCVTAFNMSDVSESSYKPNDYQDARISSSKIPLPDDVESIRLHFNPLANGGRHMVARLLYKTKKEDLEKDIDTLGYADIHVKIIKKMRKFPVGINIISGPTGSGKSTTLQKCLIALMKERRHQINVLTIEDPPEYDIPGAAQIPVMKGASDDKAKASAYTQAINAAMRSDPDVIMIGEIRTAASAGLAFEAAMTGHQVWASLHANDALSCIDRLSDMDVDMYKLTDPTLVTGLIAQRLVRQVCPHCCLSYNEAIELGLVSQEMQEMVFKIAGTEYINNIHFSNPEGCEHCAKTGISGRAVVAECIIPDYAIMKHMRDRDKAAAHKYWIEKKDGMSIFEHAIQKMLLGYCSPIDVEDRMGDLEQMDLDRKGTIMSEKFCNIPVFKKITEE